MKKSFWLVLLLLAILCGCTPGPGANKVENIPDNGQSQDDPDLLAITEVVHGFYAWYGSFLQSDDGLLNFTKEQGDHIVLDMAKLEAYLSSIKASNFISDEFINSEKALLKKCETLWQKESKDEPSSCLEADRFFCAQDWDIDLWTKAPVTVDGLGTGQVVAILSDTEGGGPSDHKLELKKENGKWLITKIDCDLGIE